MQVTKITKEQWVSIAKTAAYLAVSAVLGAALAAVTEQPELFGVYTPLVNMVLVTIKKLLTDPRD